MEASMTGKAPARFDPRSAGLLLGVCALLTALLWGLLFNPYLNPADDSGRYMVLGVSLAKTGEMRLVNDARGLLDTLYVPGFPAIIAFWLKVTGLPPGEIVPLVKATQLLFLLLTLPLLYRLLTRAGLRPLTIAVGMLLYSVCPAMIAYANEVMSEMPLILLCLGAILAAEEGTRALSTRAGGGADQETAQAMELESASNRSRLPRPNAALWIVALLCAALAYYVRAAGVVLLVSLAVWFWRRAGWRWGVPALLVGLIAVGAWQYRNASVQNLPNTRDTYMRQFTLRDPQKPSAGRIEFSLQKPIPTAIGLLGRVRRNFPEYLGNISRAVLYIMAPARTPWFALFLAAAIPLTLLTLIGADAAWRRGLWLTVGFCALFWLFVAFWPWRSPRFLVPLVPFITLFALLGGERVSLWLSRRVPARVAHAVPALTALLILAHFARAFAVIAPQEHARVLAGYRLGRNREEAGFYAACDWLLHQEPDTVVMGRPAYLLYLYSGHPTTQIEPSDRPQVQEKAYMMPNRVRYILLDRWYWSHSERYLGPYLKTYAADWRLVWQDEHGSLVRVYRRER